MRSRLTSLTVLIGLGVVISCSSDEGGDGGTGSGGTAGSSFAGKGGNSSNAGKGGVTNGGGGDADPGGAGAGVAGSGPESTFTVPEGGGVVEITGASGHAIEFEFPAAAAGEEITLAVGDATDLGWEEGAFSEVIHLGPDGATFDPPIIVRPASKDVLLLNFPNSSEKAAPDGLPFNAEKGGFELSHFSALAIVPPDKSCDSQSGWVENVDSERCAAFGEESSYLMFTCKGYNFCQIIYSACCALPGTEYCQSDSSNLQVSYIRTDSNGGQYPYCDQDTGGGGAGGAPSSGGAGGATDSGGAGGEQNTGLPTLTSINPSSLTAGSCPTTVELVGTNFDPAGSGFTNVDSAVSTTWNSSTSATITIPSCPSVGAVTDVGYVNHNGVGYDWVNRSNMQNITITAAGGTGGTSGSGGTGATGGFAGTSGSGGTGATGGFGGTSGSGGTGATGGFAGTSGSGGTGATGATGATGGSGGTGASGGTGGSGGACFYSGAEASPSGTGSCNDAFIIDLTSTTTASHTSTSGGNYWDASGSSCAGTPTRTDIYWIVPPADKWASLDVSVDAVQGVDTKISFFNSDMACYTEAVCVNDAGSGTCESGTATSAQLQTNAIFVAISTDGALTDAVTARFVIH